MSVSLTAEQLKDRLREQIALLELGCSNYDNGHLVSAIQLATSIRVIIHHTGASTSLLHRLNATHIQIISNCSPLPKPPLGAGTLVWRVHHGLMVIAIGEAGTIEPIPLMGRLAPCTPMPVEEWWNKCVIIQGDVEYTRHSIVLAAANKAGGAHVDAVLSLKENTLLHASGWSKVDPVTGDTEKLPMSYLVSIRQMAWELLNSPEFLALA